MEPINFVLALSMSLAYIPSCQEWGRGPRSREGMGRNLDKDEGALCRLAHFGNKRGLLLER